MFFKAMIIATIKKSLAVLIVVVLTMGLFSFANKQKSLDTNSNSIILGMILVEDTHSMTIKNVVDELRGKWHLKVDEGQSTDETSVLTIDGYNVAIANMPFPIPADDIKTAAEFNYFWQDGVKESAHHKGHIILSVMNAGKEPVKENILFSKVASTILKSTKSLGIYIGGRTLLLKKDFYLQNIEMMTENQLPLYCWIYFGFRKEKGKHSIYTYGLADFNKKEMEIIDSDQSMSTLNSMMFNLTHYVILNNVTLNNGETIGMSAQQKLKITESKGKYLRGNTLKIKF